MATPHWIGANLGVFSTNTNWSLTQDGPANTVAPIANDTIWLDKNHVGEIVINATASLPNAPTAINVSQGAGSTGQYAIAGANGSTAGTAWTLTNPVTINVADINSYLTIRNSITGGGTITKTGPGVIGTDTITATTWGTSPILLQAGGVFFNSANNKLGTGKITMSADTYLTNNNTTTGYSLSNPIDVRGNVIFTSLGTGSITLTAAVDFDSTTRTVTTNTGVTISGTITGTAGFTKTGAGTLSFTTASSMSGLSGTVSNTSGIINVNSTAFSNITFNNTVVSNPASQYIAFYPTVAGNFTFPVNLAFSGVGTVYVSGGNVTSAQTGAGGGFTFGDRATTGLTGQTASTSAGPVNGLAFYAASVAGNFQTIISTVRDFPNTGVVSFDYNNTATNTLPIAGTVFYAPTSGSSHTYGTRFDLITRHTSNSNTYTANISANQSSGALVLTGDSNGYAFRRVSGGAYLVTLGLSGTTLGVDNTISGSITQQDTGTLAVSKSGANRWILSGTNTYTGTTTISAGTLSAQNASALGASGSGAVTLASGATLELAGSITLNKASVAINLQGGTVKNLSGDNTYSGSLAPLTGGATTFDVTAGSLTWNPTISSATVLGIIKSSTGRLLLNNTVNSYTGTTTVNAGTLEVLRLAGLSVNSSIGGPTTIANATISMAADTTLKHSGANEANTTDRTIAVTSAGVFTIDSSGTGTSALTLSTTNSGAITLTNGSNELVFTGTNTVANTCARTIANPGTGTTALTKSGSNTWTFSGTLSYTGTTSCSAGVLDLGSTNRTLAGGVVISGGTVRNGTNTLQVPSVTMTGGSLTATLTGTGTLAVNSGSTVTVAPNAPTTGSNAQTGTTTVASGAVVDLVTPEAVTVSTAGNGRVLGNGTVSVTGTIRTKHSATSSQRGQARYKNLTLNSGSRLEIGAAA